MYISLCIYIYIKITSAAAFEVSAVQCGGFWVHHVGKIVFSLLSVDVGMCNVNVTTRLQTNSR